jgi:hypothetical protein
MKAKTCAHMDQLETIRTPEGEAVCAECVKTGSRWVHLRTCQNCGTTLCCDSSPNRHATRHFQADGHPVVASAEPSEQWLWCYEHQLFTPY